jgi:hypothetical protein
MATTTIQEQIVREAPEIEAIKLGLLKSGQKLADIPIALPEQKVAGFSPLQQQAFAGITGPQGVGAYLPGLTAGQATLGTGLGTLGTGLGTIGSALAPTAEARTAALGTAGLFAPTDLSAYTNPFQQAVIDTTLQRLQEEGERAQNQLAAQAVNPGGFGSFGGARFGLESAQLGENIQDARARILAQLNSQNYLQALQTGQSAFQNQQARQQQQSQLLSGIGGLTAQIGGQQAGIGAQQAAIGGQQIGAGQAAQQSGIKDFAALQAMGGQQQQLQQALEDAERTNAMKQLYEPYSRVSFLSDIYKGAPSTQTSLGSLTSPSAPVPSTFQQIAGAGTGLLGLGVAGKQLGGLFS